MTIEYKSTKTIFDILEEKLTSDHFLDMEGIIAEAPYYICPYDPADEQIWERNGNEGKEKTNHIKQLANRVERIKGIKCLCVDLLNRHIFVIRDCQQAVVDVIFGISHQRRVKQALYILLATFKCLYKFSRTVQ